MKKIYLLAILALLISGPACSPSSNLPSTGESAAEPTGRIYFQENFSDDTTGWPSIRTDDRITDYENGVYRIFVNLNNDDYLVTPGLSLPSDVRVEVDATKVAGSDNNDFGILCRYQDNDNLYQFVVSSDGYVGIVKLVDGSMQSLAAETLLESSAVNGGNAQNHIRADCIGNTLTLYVNGQQVSTVQDAAFTSGGDVGIFAGTYDTPGADIHFDNFIVTAS